MNMKPGKPAPYTAPKKVYQPPQLVVFGKIHTIVTGGSGVIVEGQLMLLMSRQRP